MTDHNPPNDQSQLPLTRLKWRCRRGLLELDLVLGKFVDERYAGLDEDQKQAFDELLDMPDTQLWDMITGKQVAHTAQQRGVLEQMTTTNPDGAH